MGRAADDVVPVSPVAMAVRVPTAPRAGSAPGDMATGSTLISRAQTAVAVRVAVARTGVKRAAVAVRVPDAPRSGAAA